MIYRVVFLLCFILSTKICLAEKPSEKLFTVTLVLSPSDSQNMDEGKVLFALLRSGSSSAAFRDEHSTNKTCFYNVPSQGGDRIVLFKKVPGGKYTLFAFMHEKAETGIAEVPVSKINVKADREIALDLPPIYTIKLRVKVAPAFWQNVIAFSVRITGIGAEHKGYTSTVPMVLEGSSLVGNWDSVLAPGKYRLYLDAVRGGAATERTAPREAALGDIYLTPNNLIDGTLTFDAMGAK